MCSRTFRGFMMCGESSVYASLISLVEFPPKFAIASGLRDSKSLNVLSQI